MGNTSSKKDKRLNHEKTSMPDPVIEKPPLIQPTHKNLPSPKYQLFSNIEVPHREPLPFELPIDEDSCCNCFGLFKAKSNIEQQHLLTKTKKR